MTCDRCNKRLSRKTARQIGREVICSACLFPEMKAGIIIPNTVATTPPVMA